MRHLLRLRHARRRLARAVLLRLKRHARVCGGCWRLNLRRARRLGLREGHSSCCSLVVHAGGFLLRWDGAYGHDVACARASRCLAGLAAMRAPPALAAIGRGSVLPASPRALAAFRLARMTQLDVESRARAWGAAGASAGRCAHRLPLAQQAAQRCRAVMEAACVHALHEASEALKCNIRRKPTSADIRAPAVPQLLRRRRHLLRLRPCGPPVARLPRSAVRGNSGHHRVRLPRKPRRCDCDHDCCGDCLGSNGGEP